MPEGPLLQVAQPVQGLAQLGPHMVVEEQLKQAPVAEGEPPRQVPQLAEQVEPQPGPKRLAGQVMQLPLEAGVPL